MAFNENPIVDDNAHLSEESVNAVKSAFTSKRGFRCRDQNPDNGVDQNVELLNDRSEATGRLFGIQIKSTKVAKIRNIEGEHHLVWQFKTSRLGYLRRYAPPGYGLVIIYVEETGKCYFDYAEEIVDRLNKSQQNSAWEDQQTVNIHIPLSNEVTPESIQMIYSKLIQRFNNHELFLSTYGKSFDLPTLNKFPQTGTRFPLEDLEVGIIYLIEKNEFNKICQLIHPYSHHEIGKFKMVCLFGMYAWMEVGHVYEAKSLLARCKRFESEFDAFEKEVYIMAQHRLHWLFGDISLDDFCGKMEAELEKFENPINVISIQLNLFFLKTSNLNVLEAINYELESEFKIFFHKLSKIDISERGRQVLILQLCDRVSGYVNTLLSRLTMIMNTQKSIGGPLQEEGHELIDRINNMGIVVSDHITSSIQYGITKDDKLIHATALFIKAKHFLQVQFIIALQGNTSPWSTELKTDYQRSFIAFINYYNSNIEESHYYDAYLALNHASDILTLYSMLYNDDLNDEKSQNLIKISIKIQDEFGFKPYKSQIEEGLRISSYQRENLHNAKLENATDAQLLMIAKQIQTSEHLPEDRLGNILSELKTYRRFDQACKNPNIELLTETNLSQKSYINPVKYKLRSRITGMETPNSRLFKILCQVKKLRTFHQIYTDKNERQKERRLRLSKF